MVEIRVTISDNTDQSKVQKTESATCQIWNLIQADHHIDNKTYVTNKQADGDRIEVKYWQSYSETILPLL